MGLSLSTKTHFTGTDTRTPASQFVGLSGSAEETYLIVSLA